MVPNRVTRRVARIRKSMKMGVANRVARICKSVARIYKSVQNRVAGWVARISNVRLFSIQMWLSSLVVFRCLSILGGFAFASPPEVAHEARTDGVSRNYVS